MDRVWMDYNGVLKLKGKRKRYGGDKHPYMHASNFFYLSIFLSFDFLTFSMVEYADNSATKI